MIKIDTYSEPLPDVDFSIGVNGSTSAESIDPLLEKTAKRLRDQDGRVENLSRLTSAGDRRRAKLNRFAVLGATIVTIAGGALLINSSRHESGQSSDTPAVLDHIEDWKTAQSMIDPTSSDVGQRQAAANAAIEVLGPQP